jgi:hypothetical protein
MSRILPPVSRADLTKGEDRSQEENQSALFT